MHYFSTVLLPLAIVLSGATEERSLNALGNKWDADWTLGGKYNEQTGQYVHNCGCKNVQWGKFGTESECLAEVLSKNNCSDGSGPVQYYDKNFDLGGVSTDKGWRKLCNCKAVGWTSKYTSQDTCKREWVESDETCLVLATDNRRSLNGLGSKWEPDWTLGGKYNRESGQYEHFCGCKAVQWGQFDSEVECSLDVFSKNMCIEEDATVQHYARNWDLGGTTVEGTWRLLCDCKAVGWKTPFTEQRACKRDWIEADSNCLVLSTDSRMLESERGLGAALGGRWEPDWTLGGEYNNDKGYYEHNCGCKNVQWGKFKSDFECETSVYMNNKCTSRYVVQFYDRNHDLGGITTTKGWMKLCDCTAVGWTTDFTSQKACKQEWIRTDNTCLVLASDV
eukprot:Platyproteum_vivax@DN6288_c0_g1_i1.p1